MGRIRYTAIIQTTKFNELIPVVSWAFTHFGGTLSENQNNVWDLEIESKHVLFHFKNVNDYTLFVLTWC